MNSCLVIEWLDKRNCYEIVCEFKLLNRYYDCVSNYSQFRGENEDDMTCQVDDHGLRIGCPLTGGSLGLRPKIGATKA